MDRGNIDVLIPEEKLQNRIKELGKQITSDYEGKVLTLICVLKGAVMFMTDLSKTIDLDVEFDFMDISSYGNSMESSGIVKINYDLSDPITGKDVLLVEDIIDTGRTLSGTFKHLISQKPASLKLCTLLDKPDRRVISGITADYTGFVIPDKFVVGYGLDYAQKYRNLPYVGVINSL